MLQVCDGCSSADAFNIISYSVINCAFLDPCWPAEGFRISGYSIFGQLLWIETFRFTASF